MRGLLESSVAVMKLAGVVGAVALFTPAPSHAQCPAPPIAVRQGDHLAQQPFQANWGVPFNSPGDGEIPVPAGKRLVLEYASLDVTVASDCRAGFLSVRTTAGGTSAGHFVPITGHFTFGTRNVEVTGQPIKVYADPATTASVSYGIAGTNCDPIGVITVSGYFVDAP